MRSVRLLQEMRQSMVRNAIGKGAPPLRPRSSQGFAGSRPSPTPGQAPQGPEPGAGSLIGKPLRMPPVGQGPSLSPKERPDWNVSFRAVHQQRIPTYDALIDGHCHTMSNPVL